MFLQTTVVHSKASYVTVMEVLQNRFERTEKSDAIENPPTRLRHVSLLIEKTF